VVEEDLKSKDSEDRKLQQELAAIERDIQSLSSAVSSGDYDSLKTALEGEKAALENGVAESVKRVELLKNDWQGLSALTSTGAGQVKAFERESAQLKEALARKEDVLKGLRQQAAEQKKLLEQLSNEASAAELLNQKQVESVELNLELQALQNDVAALQEQAVVLSESGAGPAPQRKKKEELLKELALRNTTLKSELSRVQQEMVKLDKRKITLEKTLYKPKY
jgi:chromosome segregation ATPase